MKNLTGLKFGFLKVIEYSHTHTQPCGAKVHYWKLKCDCGNEISRMGISLTSSKSNVQNCGCKRKDLIVSRSKTHGLRNTRAYVAWRGAKSRCENPKDKHYKDYGGRGIKLCEEWSQSVTQFYNDMGEPVKGLSLDRIDNNKGYSKDNCRWATKIEQARNTRGNRIIQINGEKLCLTEWCNKYKLKISTVSHRLKAGWSAEKAVLTQIANKRIRSKARFAGIGKL